MSRATPPLPQTPALRDVQLDTRDNFTFTYDITDLKSTRLHRLFSVNISNFLCSKELITSTYTLVA